MSSEYQIKTARVGGMRAWSLTDAGRIFIAPRSTR
jgi:hypothetical protein